MYIIIIIYVYIYVYNNYYICICICIVYVQVTSELKLLLSNLVKHEIYVNVKFCEDEPLTLN